ncbi:MAG: polysaccharide deacetylase family protein [Hyphomicrobium sp.]|jgi:peptidoglycan/xylan/chitin deacetylase (PgdA/CDA1 family)
MRRLLFAVVVILPASMAFAEDGIHNVNAVAGDTQPAAADDAAKSATEEVKPVIDCADKLGVSRVAEVDTTGGGQYGEQYPPTKLLEKGEVVITFDDGPHPVYTKQILAALAEQCTKATFFNVGEMIKNFPEIAKEVQAAGHTVGTHTWSHRNLGAISLDRAKSQIESTINIAETTLPQGVAPFFRFPYLSDPKRVRDYLATRNIAVMGIDADSLDWRARTPEKVIHNVFSALDKSGGGIILFHDIHPQTAKAIPTVLAELKARGYKVVHLVPKSRIETIAMSEPEAAPRRRGHKSRRHKH